VIGAALPVAILAVAFALVVGLPSLYLAVLAGVTLVPRPMRPREDALRTFRFAILVPAHDEELRVGRTTASLLRLDYPQDRFTVHVLADNCHDTTAAVARRHGACVHERNDARRSGKGAALNWLRHEVDAEVLAIDAFVLVDADSELSPDFLWAMADHLAAGAEVAQAVHLAEPDDHPLVQIRELAFRLTCHLRPLANTILGGSSGLHGTGMCFAAPVFRRYVWSESSVVEDGELSLRLIRDGHSIALATDATVRQPVPGTFRQARSQAIRWERGRFDHTSEVFGLLRRGIARRDRNALLFALGALIPPYTVLAAGALLALGVGAALGSQALVFFGLASLLCLLLYVLRGAALGRLGPATLLRIMVWAPPYIAWKLWVLVLAASGAGRGDWIRTHRAG
jgi:cellulose synthase/poly-beta-1,6-N-acetylglucosamine synthase-like glycosyltransferase